ncbi:hypothetical protein N7466_011311 [Penicillium verhagenii]|uniref:uncharacterized protein n=1 Tax=Penicillium verhagenii TaxID=1562060 RepID=UPI00254592FB|nr:uncharacterized protein N7466_011311 [Penicillium verhagenii]KAJ5915378.1 hypothetical protein N7466_011311 [Penicillium verhagenii]
MAIFDSEKRPRGLRVPSLTAMKNGANKSQFSFGSKKSIDVKTPEHEVTPVVAVDVPALPPQRAPPPNKELPPRPKSQIPPPPRMLTKVPPRRQVPNSEPNGNQPATQPPVNPPTSAQPQPQQAQPQAQAQAQFQAPSPPFQSSPQAASPQSQVYAPYTPSATLPAAPQPVRPAERSVVVESKAQQDPASFPAVPPVTLSPPPSDDNEALTPLEDFIPTPDESGTPLGNLSTEELSMPPMPDVEPVAAPLNKVHFACFQEHRNMPVAQNVWCPLPCQTCHKFDREIRHRCVFCSLRVCEGCYQTLQKCKNRSLNELMQKIG